MAKVLTMLLVIIGHSHYYSIETGFGGISHLTNSPTIESMIFRVINFLIGFIYSFHMPFFMALSGMTYFITYNPQKTFWHMAAKKAKRLLIPFLGVTVFLSVPLKYFSGYWDQSANMFYDILVGQFLLFGNSHLWFVVSLFLIIIIYTLLVKARLPQSILFWGICLIFGYIGLWLERKGCYLGVSGALKNFIYFAIGVRCFNRTKSIHPKGNMILLSWILMVVTYMAILYFTKSQPELKRLKFITYIPMAIWGGINMVLLSKFIISSTTLVKTRLYKSLASNSYGLYLYSDPFNYILITALVMLFGDDIAGNNSISLLAFTLRVILSLGFAYLIIWLISAISRISIPQYSLK